MPNHISNRVQLKSLSDDWKREDEAFKQLEEMMKTEWSTFDFNVLVPYPEHFKVLDDAANKLEKEVGLAAAMRVKDGYNSGGYEWCIANWGTKWNAYDIGFGYDEAFFQTAWSTPKPIWVELSKRFPDLQLEIEYADEDRGSNCGRLKYINGKLVAFEDVSEYPHAELFARAIIAEQELAHNWAEYQKLKGELEALQQPTLQPPKDDEL